MAATASLQTTQRIIRLAYKDAGLIQDGDDLDGEQYAEGLMRLNDLANLWQTQGIKLWLLEDVTVTLVAGTRVYTLGPGGDVEMNKPLRVVQGYYKDSAGLQRPLDALAREDYYRLSAPTSQGPVTAYYADKQNLLLEVAVWMVPDTTAATGTLQLLAQTQVQNMVSLTDTDAFPVEWGLALRWGLADDLATGQPAAIMQRCAQKAEAFRGALEDWDVEDASVRFAVDVRG